MTEPTNAWLGLEADDVPSLEREIWLDHTVGDRAAARERLREALAAAWEDGQSSGAALFRHDVDTRSNPYDETDK